MCQGAAKAMLPAFGSRGACWVATKSRRPAAEHISNIGFRLRTCPPSTMPSLVRSKSSQNSDDAWKLAMLRATEIIRAGLWNARPADVVRLDYDRRTRRRIALTGAGGLAFLLDLAKAPVLAAGDGLRLEDGRIVAVEAESERLLEISCRGSRLLSRIAWHLGTRHMAAEI